LLTNIPNAVSRALRDFKLRSTGLSIDSIHRQTVTSLGFHVSSIKAFFREKICTGAVEHGAVHMHNSTRTFTASCGQEQEALAESESMGKTAVVSLISMVPDFELE
jgi:hypothetical protein